jgi:Protein of unknown function (DUF3987)
VSPVDRIVTALEARGLSVRGSAERGLDAQCSAHEDRVSSLSIREGDDGRALIHCHAGCSVEQILGALNLELRDLFAADVEPSAVTMPRVERRATRPRLASAEQIADWQHALLAHDGVIRRLRELRGWTRDAIESLGLGYDGERIVFPVLDASGGLVGVARYLPGERSNGARKMLADAGSARELWPGPESLDGKGRMWIVEGEPDAVSLTSIGCVATAVPGAASWRREWAARFADRDVIVCTDCDKPGRELAGSIADDLDGIARSLRVLDLERSRTDGYDVGDLVREAVVDGPEGVGSLRQLLNRMADDTEPCGLDWPTLSSRTLPAFPAEALPCSVATWVNATAEHTQTPVDLPALAALGVLSGAAIGGAVVDCGVWDEELGLYLLPAMPSGERKSAVLKAATRPLREIERERADLAAPRVRELRSRREVLELQARNLTKVAARENSDPAERFDADQQMAAVGAELDSIGQPSVPRLLADDATPEALAGLLSKHGSIAVLAAESALIDNLAGRYSDGKANLHLVCAAYSGEPTTIDRKGDDPQRIDRPVLTIGLVVQPHVLEGLISHPTARAQGLVARFAYALPETQLGRRKINASPVSTAVSEGWAAAVRHVAKSADKTDKTPLNQSSVSFVSTPEPARITLTTAASRLLTELQERIEPRLGPAGDLHSVADWAGRHHGRVARIAGLLHLCEHDATEPIAAETMDAALRIGDYLLAHGVEALMGPDDKTRRALRWLERRGEPTVTVRELHRGPCGTRGPVEQAQELARGLERLGALRPLLAAESALGRPKSPAYAVNPRLVGRDS